MMHSEAAVDSLADASALRNSTVLVKGTCLTYCYSMVLIVAHLDGLWTLTLVKKDACRGLGRDATYV